MPYHLWMYDLFDLEIRFLAEYMGDICLRSRLEGAFPKRYSFGSGVAEEFPFPRNKIGFCQEITKNIS